jgi:sugar lactone lactonase YvrE
VVRSFDRKSGRPIANVPIASANFLNDLSAAPDGLLYVSDSGLAKIKGVADPQKNGADAIYTVDARGAASALVKGADLGQPNGLLADAAGVWVASLAGQLYRVDPKGQRQAVVALPGSGLDGLVQTGSGSLIVSSWETSTVYVAKAPLASPAPPGAFEPLITELETPGDLGYDPTRRQLMVPLFQQNAVYIQQIPADAG